MMTDETIELRFFRLVTGEDIIAQTHINRLDTGNVYILLEPLKIGYVIQDSGRVGISLYQWIFPKITEEQKFPIFPSDILTTAKPSARMIKYYWDTIARYGKNDEEDTSIRDDYDYDETGGEDEMTEEDQKNIMDELEKIKRKYH